MTKSYDLATGDGQIIRCLAKIQQSNLRLCRRPRAGESLVPMVLEKL
ncbi:hypothetical protein PAMC26510_24070 [Caballeronia sordidicola]|uniref:Uncharacterized protein n=1 Tax=Caballeronia sordidicola TaxID=196367 RepID=A0A242MIF7_CABSO|nr:hypothetical protein PAMC26510_24070 [Caballeronia sordidicola]